MGAGIAGNDERRPGVETRGSRRESREIQADKSQANSKGRNPTEHLKARFSQRLGFDPPAPIAGAWLASIIPTAPGSNEFLLSGRRVPPLSADEESEDFHMRRPEE